MSGFIAELGADRWHHRFGGSSWEVFDPNGVYGGPSLILVLDLADPRLEHIVADASELPLASYINCSAWVGRQHFSIDHAARRLVLVYREVVDPEPLDELVRLPSPLPERQLRLRTMVGDELLLDDDARETAADEFVGGHAFLRILGPPLWLYFPVEESCICGHKMDYLAAVGYENYSRPAGYLDDEPFFIGEGALYFFICARCRNLTVLSQPS